MADGSVVEILLAVAAGHPVRSVDRVEAVAGAGLAGDRYASGTGTFAGWPAGGRHVTLVEAEVVQAVAAAAGDLRRNIVTSGIRLDDLIGADFGIGGAVLRGVRPCDPCALLDRRVRAGLRQALAGRGGLRADVVRSGAIAVGDAVAAVTGDSTGAPRMLTR